MKNIVFLVISLIIYLLVLLLVLLKICDVWRNPEKYKNEEYEKKLDEIINKPFFHYAQNSCLKKYLLCALLGWVLFSLLSITVFLFIPRVFFVKGQDIPLNYRVGSLVGLLALSIMMNYVLIPILLKNPTLDASCKAIDGFDRVQIYKQSFVAMAVVFALAMPFAILSANTYLCFDDDAIYYSRYFQLTETVVPYGDVMEVRVTSRLSGNHGNVVFSYIVIMSDGTQFNMNRTWRSATEITEKTYQLHRNLERAGKCEFYFESLTAEELDYVAGLNIRQREIIEYIYEGFHTYW